MCTKEVIKQFFKSMVVLLVAMKSGDTKLSDTSAAMMRFGEYWYLHFDVHLEHGERVHFTETTVQRTLEERKETTLTAF